MPDDDTTAPTDPPASPWDDIRAREDRRNEKREAVLRTAVRHFNTRGFRATSLNGVAARTAGDQADDLSLFPQQG